MIYLAELIDAEEAKSAGFLAKIVEAEKLDETVAALCRQIAAYAPVTLRTAKEQFRRFAPGMCRMIGISSRHVTPAPIFMKAWQAIAWRNGARWQGA